MKRLLTVFMVALLASVWCWGSLLAEEPPYLLVRVDAGPDVKMKPLLELGLDIVDGVKGQYLEVVCFPEDLNRIQALGYAAQVKIEDMQSYYADRFATDEMGGHRTYSEMRADMEQFHVLYPDITSEVFSIGESIEGRQIWGMKVSDNPAVNEDEPEVLFNGLTHAREPIGMTICMALIDSLCSNYGIDPDITYLVDNREIYFVPCVNPDGYVYNEQTSPSGGGMWRKNRRNNGSNYGVDLNRNFGFNWGYNNIGSSGSTGSETYRGTAPFSEPETEALRQFCNDHIFSIAQNFHSYSDLMLYSWSIPDPPWGYTPDNAAFQNLCSTMYQWNNYTYGTCWEILYQVNGDANDWMYGEQIEKPKTMAWVFEVGSSFWPSVSSIPGLVAENIEPAFFMMLQAENFMPQPVSLVYTGGVIDDASGNNNGGLDPGESVTFIPTLQNNGWITGTGINANLVCTDPYITITQSASTYPDLDPHGNAPANTPYGIDVSSSAPLEYPVSFRLEWSCNEGYTGTSSFDLIVGDPLYQPMGPDAYGYMAYDNLDEGGPVFDWIEIEPTAGGSGTPINFTQDDETVQLTLPFDFQYYGQNFTQISVCSNGWIAMGSTTDTDYSNSGIPDSDGPAAMIAPFWEDLSPQQSGSVSTYHDAANHTYIVEFYQVRQYLPETAFETFEIVLYDPDYHTTTTGDGQILFQYNGITDPSACTVGIEDPVESTGLQLLYNNSLDPHVPMVAQGVAVFFTTPVVIPDLTIALTYVSGSPIPPAGGNLYFDVYVENVGTTPANFDAWLDIVYEGGAPTTAVLRAFSNYLPGWTINRPNMFYPVPSAYAAGNYDMFGRLGNHPSEVWYESSFPFEKSGDDAVANFQPFVPDGVPNPFDEIITGQVDLPVPDQLSLSQNYPNPFNPTTSLQYSIPAGGFVSLKVFDVMGREVAKLVDGYRDAGIHHVGWDASNMASGIYFYVLNVGDQHLGGKMVLLK
ncbi:T9SS type A sorting domain-containing protein [bacterium]|nr:T9SS type A sorting domain-containing protein [bacterium]